MRPLGILDIETIEMDSPPEKVIALGLERGAFSKSAERITNGTPRVLGLQSLRQHIDEGLLVREVRGASDGRAQAMDQAPFSTLDLEKAEKLHAIPDSLSEGEGLISRRLPQQI